MATQKQRAAESEPVAPQTSPPAPYGHGGADLNGFIWQQLSDMQRTLGAIQEAQRLLVTTQERSDTKTSSKLAAIEADLAEIKQIKHTAKWLLIVCTAVGGVVITVMGFIAKEVWDIGKPLVLEKLSDSRVVAPSVPPAMPTAPPPSGRKL